MSPRAIVDLIGGGVQLFVEERGPRLGAALAFYTVISLTPLLMVLVGVAGALYGEDTVRSEIIAQIGATIGPEAAELVDEALGRADARQQGRVAALIGLGALLVGATTVFAQLKMGLNDLWHVRPPKAPSPLAAVRQFLVTRVLVFAVVLGIGFLLLLSLVASAAIEAMATYFDDLLPLPAGTLRLLNLGLSLVLMTLLFAYLYRAVPDVRIRWRDVWFGAIVTSVLFNVGRHAIGIYLGGASVGSAYGAAGALVVLLVWVYFSAQIFFFGAALTRVYAERFGSHWTPRRGFETVDPLPGERAPGD